MERSQRFDNKARDYKELLEIVKKMIKTEENIIQTRINFKKKWLEIANIETNQDLSRGLQSYSKALDEIENTQRELLLIMKTNVLESIKKYPERLKEQRRSLSACSKTEREMRDSKSKLDRIQTIKDQRSIDSRELDLAAKEFQEKESIYKKKTENTDKDIEEKNKVHQEDVRNLIMLLTHGKIRFHAAAIQNFTEAFREILSISGKN